MLVITVTLLTRIYRVFIVQKAFVFLLLLLNLLQFCKTTEVQRREMTWLKLDTKK